MKQEQEFLNNWINDVANEQQPNETLEYSEREVLEMLKDYKEKFSLSDVGKSFYCDNLEEEGKLSCGKQCDFCKEHH